MPVFPSQAVLAIVILSLIAAAPAPAGDHAKVPKPRLDLRATPRFSFTPSTVLVTAELNGGDDAEEFYCPAVVWDWDDGGRSANESDCPPFQPGTPVERRFNAVHAYLRPEAAAPGVKPRGRPAPGSSRRARAPRPRRGGS